MKWASARCGCFQHTHIYTPTLTQTPHTHINTHTSHTCMLTHIHKHTHSHRHRHSPHTNTHTHPHRHTHHTRTGYHCKFTWVWINWVPLQLYMRVWINWVPLQLYMRVWINWVPLQVYRQSELTPYHCNFTWECVLTGCHCKFTCLYCFSFWARRLYTGEESSMNVPILLVQFVRIGRHSGTVASQSFVPQGGGGNLLKIEVLSLKLLENCMILKKIVGGAGKSPPPRSASVLKLSNEFAEENALRLLQRPRPSHARINTRLARPFNVMGWMRRLTDGIARWVCTSHSRRLPKIGISKTKTKTKNKQTTNQKISFFPRQRRLIKDRHCWPVLLFLCSPIEWLTFCQN